MASSERRRRWMVSGVVLLFASVLLFGLAAVLDGTERHAYSRSALPPSDVTVTSGDTYRISIDGGVKALLARNIDPSGLQCEWSSPGTGSQLLSIVAEGAQSKATDVIATFTAPVGGPIHVDCVGWGAVFVDDADNASWDVAGLCLLLGIIAFGAGLLILASPRFRFDSGAGRPSERSAREDQEIERLVHIVHVRSEDGEGSDADGRDVAP